MKLPSVPGLEVALSMSGVDMHEYDDEADSEQAEYTRYVEAVSGANFAVELRTDKRFKWQHVDLRVRIYLDGSCCTDLAFYPRAGSGGHGPVTVTGRKESQHGRGVLRKFTFADLRTSETHATPT